MAKTLTITSLLSAVFTLALCQTQENSPANQSRGRSCVGGHRHGSYVHLTLYWYLCEDGELQPRGCFAPNRNKLDIGQSYVSGGLRLVCESDENRVVRLRYAGCEVDGDLHGPNEFWDDPRTNLWYYCEQLGAALRLNLGGCVMDGERIGKSTSTVKQGVIYKCEEASANKPAGLVPTGCMHYAKRYNLGNSFQDEKFWYMCSSSADGSAAIRKGERVEVGERWVVEENVIIECKADEYEKLHFAPVGCITDHGPKELGEKWSVGYPPYRYEMTCLPSSNGYRTESKPTGCAYVDSQMIEIPIAVGCYEIVDDQAIACKKRPSDGKLMYTIFGANQANFAPAFGVKDCDIQE